LDAAPPDARPQGFGGGFLGGEARGQGFGAPATLGYLARGEDAPQEAVGVTMDGRGNARDLHQVYAAIN
jgi:hypothetical protein